MRLTPAEFAATEEKIEKLNKRAAKKGWTGRITVKGSPVTVKNVLPNGLDVTQQMIDAEISGEPPKYEGWTFLARLEWDRNSGLVVYNAPGAPTINRDGLREGACDHCKIDRYRRNVYLVADDCGQRIQVGSTCLKDFLGWNTNPVWIGTDEFSEESLFGGGYGYTDPEYSTDTVLAAAWAAIQEFGYHRSDSEFATKYTVLAVLNPRSAGDRELSKRVTPHIPDAGKMAKVIREWVLSPEFKGDSDYVVNLKNIARGDFVTAKRFGFLVSAPQAWAKAQELDLIRRAEKKDVLNEWIGQPGDKLELTVTLKSIRSIDSYYGVSDLYTFEDESHRVIKWFSSRTIFRETSDEPIKIKGTVKKHDEYKGMKATVLTRVKVI